MSSPYKLPQQGQPSAAVLDEIRDLRATMTSNDRGKLSSTAFQGRDEMGELITAAFTEFLGWNGLFSFQEAAAARALPVHPSADGGRARETCDQQGDGTGWCRFMSSVLLRTNMHACVRTCPSEYEAAT